MQLILRAPWNKRHICLVLLYKQENAEPKQQEQTKRPKILTGSFCCITGFPPGASGSLHQNESRGEALSITFVTSEHTDFSVVYGFTSCNFGNRYRFQLLRPKQRQNQDA